jgi:16S rRNA G966 N2-methylase RsmD
LGVLLLIFVNAGIFGKMAAVIIGTAYLMDRDQYEGGDDEGGDADNGDAGADGADTTDAKPKKKSAKSTKTAKTVKPSKGDKSAGKSASKSTHTHGDNASASSNSASGTDTVYKKIDLDKFADNTVITLDSNDADYDTIREWFPDDIKDKNKLQIVKESIFSLSRKRDSEKTSESIKSILKDKDISTLTITDATANVGGNVLNFSKHFKSVNAVEIDKNAFSALSNNIKVAGLSNVKASNDDYDKIKNDLKQDVIFFDPPWGGIGYWRENNLMLKLGDKPIYDVIKEIKNKPDLIIIKAPKNFGFAEFKQKIDSEHVWFKKISNHMMVYVRYGTGPRPVKPVSIE